MTLSVSNGSLLLGVDAFADDVDAGAGAGVLRIYDGTIPTDADTALSGNTLLAELTMSDPAFNAAGDQAPGARATAASITSDTSANATGTASFFRILDSDLNGVLQGRCGTSGQELNLNTLALVILATVAVTSLNLDHPE